MANRMIMKSEKQEEEENAAALRDSNKQHVEKVCSSSPQAIGLPGYYLNGMGMQSIARLGNATLLRLMHVIDWIGKLICFVFLFW